MNKTHKWKLIAKKYYAFKFYKNPRFTLKKKTTQIYLVHRKFRSKTDFLAQLTNDDGGFHSF